MRRFLPAILLAAAIPPARAATVQVASLDALVKAASSAKAGDEVVLADGEYTASGTLNLVNAAGTADRPVTIRAASIGKATIKGTAAIVIDRSAHLNLQGFRFTFTPSADKGVQVKGSRNIGILDNHFELAEPAAKNYWLVVDGALPDGSAPHQVTIARNNFWNKAQEGCFVVIYGVSSPYRIARNVFIEGNHFRNHSFTGSNGGEAIRFGDSNRQNDLTDSRIRGNLFENCNGDVEVVSVKTTRLRVEGNTLRGNQGSIVLRHGDSCIVAGNFLIGNRGGIRIYGDHQVVIGNYLEGNTNTKPDGSASGSYATLAIGMGSQPDLADGENTYDQPSNGLVAFNTLVGNDSRGLEVVRIKTETFAPAGMAILNNVVVSDKGSLSSFAVDPTNATIGGNLLFGKATAGPLASAFGVDPLMARGPDSLMRPGGNSPVVDAAVASVRIPSWYRTDMDGQARSAAFDLGADEVSAAETSFRPLVDKDVGPKVPTPVGVELRPRSEGSGLRGPVEVRLFAVDGRVVRAPRLDASEMAGRRFEGLRPGIYHARLRQGRIEEVRTILVP